MSLPIFQDSNKNLMLLETNWASQLNPLLSNPLLGGFQLSNIGLNNGVTMINHLLQRKMQGWFIIDQDGAASIYRSQPFNSTTLTLTSNAAVTVNLWVF